MKNNLKIKISKNMLYNHNPQKITDSSLLKKIIKPYKLILLNFF